MNMGPSGLERSGTREREKDRLVLLVQGRDDLLLSGTSIRSAVLSDIDTSTWRNRASLRVRYFSRVIEGMAIVDGRQSNGMCRLEQRGPLASPQITDKTSGKIA